MDRGYIEKQYHLAMLEFKTAHNEEAQWQARKNMALLERTALELFDESFVNELREREALEQYK